MLNVQCGHALIFPFRPWSGVTGRLLWFPSALLPCQARMQAVCAGRGEGCQARRQPNSEAQARPRFRARFAEGLLAGAAVAVRAAVAARSAKTEAPALTSVPTPAANVPSAVMAVQAWSGSATGQPC